MANNTEIFSNKADFYAKSRSSYSNDAIAYLLDNGLSRKSTVADIGSGTGIFTKLLLDIGAEVYAVEPNNEMRQYAEKNLSSYQKFHSIAAPAEKTALADKSIDLITAAQAFHWFEPEQFKKECKRILKNGGKVVLLWNNGEKVDHISEEINDLINKYNPAQKEEKKDVPSIIEKIKIFYKKFEKIKFDNPITYNKENFILFILSTSASLKENDENFFLFIEELERIFDKYQKDGVITSLKKTVLYIGEI